MIFDEMRTTTTTATTTTALITQTTTPVTTAQTVVVETTTTQVTQSDMPAGAQGVDEHGRYYKYEGGKKYLWGSIPGIGSQSFETEGGAQLTVTVDENAKFEGGFEFGIR